MVWNEFKYKAKLEKEYQNLPEITCNASQINQVVMNLLVNAAQAISDFGLIGISTGASEDKVWIEIADNGRGMMTEATQKKILNPSLRLKIVREGTGLGLSVDYNIIKTHGGRLSVTSQLGERSIFPTLLPIKQLKPVEEQA